MLFEIMILNNKINKIEGYVLIKNGHVYDPFSDKDDNLDILIKDKKIIDIDKNKIDSKFSVIDANNKIVTNGFIDLHAPLEPGYEYKEFKNWIYVCFFGGFTEVVVCQIQSCCRFTWR